MKPALTVRLRTVLKRNAIAYLFYGYLRKIAFELRMLLDTWQYWQQKKRSDFSTSVPIPPPRLRYWVHGDTSESSFLEGGRCAFEDIRKLLGIYAAAAGDRQKYLDFGCGCGRVLRHYFEEGAPYDFWGIDIDTKSIEWNNSNLAGMANWRIIKSEPPTEFNPGEFAIVVANSVFTHLDEEHQIEWLKEIARLLSRDGIAILSIHGEPVWETLETIPNLGEIMRDHGFYFHINNVGIRNFAGFPEFYQTTYHSKQYVYERWSEYFEILDYIDKGIGNHQTAIIVRPRGSAK